VQNCCIKQPGPFVFLSVKTENVRGHLCNISSTVNWMWIVGVSICRKDTLIGLDFLCASANNLK
jgi:hypothetical protein